MWFIEDNALSFEEVNSPIYFEKIVYKDKWESRETIQELKHNKFWLIQGYNRAEGRVLSTEDLEWILTKTQFFRCEDLSPYHLMSYKW